MGHVAKVHDDLEMGMWRPANVNFFRAHSGDLLTGLDFLTNG